MGDRRKVDWDDEECVSAYYKSPGEFETEDWFGRGDYTRDRHKLLEGVTINDCGKDLAELRELEARGMNPIEALIEAARRRASQPA